MTHQSTDSDSISKYHQNPNIFEHGYIPHSYRSTHSLQIQLPCTSPTMEYHHQCIYCKESHPPDLTCVSLCFECYSVHCKSDLVEGMCPRKTVFAMNNGRKEGIPCEYCKQEQIDEAEQHLSKQFASLSINADAEVQREIDCARCGGSKVIPRLVECCELGCSNCGYLKLKINPFAKQQHMKSIPSPLDQDCAICHTAIVKGDPVFLMQCNHQYHYLCLSDWLKISPSCPVCRQKDMFIELTSSYYHQVRRLRLQSGQKQAVSINEQGEIVIGFGSESSQEQQYQAIFSNPFDDEIIMQ